MNFKYIVSIILFIHFFSAIAIYPEKNSLCSITILNNNKKQIKLAVETADTEAKRRYGLMFRKSLDQNRGMLFVFPFEIMLDFWMKNTYIPLSIAYIDKNFIINEIYDMKPLDTSIKYPSKRAAKYALEVNQGWFKKHNITKGCRIILNGCFSKQDTFLKR